MDAYGYPLAASVLCAAVAMFGWLHARRRDGSGALPAGTARVISLFAALAATFAVAGIPLWRNALAGVFGTGPGMVVLVVIMLAGGGSFVIDHLQHHHPVRSTALGIIGATAGAMAWAMAPELGRQGSKLGPKTAAAMGQAMDQIRSGHAARAETSGTRAMIIFVAILVLITILVAMHRHHRNRPFATARRFGETPAVRGGPPRAITAGPGYTAGAPRARTPATSDRPKGFMARLTGADKIGADKAGAGK